jgi:hypothetical protein
MTGPYETEQQMRELPAVRAIYDAMHASHRRGVIGELGYRLLDEACEAASVEIGAYDHRILTWLAGFEPETCAVVAGLITRAYQAGTAVTGEHPVMLTAAQAAAVRRALGDAEVYRRRAAAWCADRESSPTGTYTDHMDDLDVADAYRDLASELTRVWPEPPGGGHDA